MCRNGSPTALQHKISAARSLLCTTSVLLSGFEFSLGCELKYAAEGFDVDRLKRLTAASLCYCGIKQRVAGRSYFSLFGHGLASCNW